MARRAGRPMAATDSRRRSGPGVRHWRRHHGFHVDRSVRARRRPRTGARGGCRPQSAGWRQHGSGIGAAAAAAARGERAPPRHMAAPHVVAPVPNRERGAAQRSGHSRAARHPARKRVASHRRHDHRPAFAGGRQPGPAGRLLSRRPERRRAGAPAARGLAGAWIAVRGRSGGDPAPRALLVPAGFRYGTHGVCPAWSRRARLPDAPPLQRRRHESAGAARADRVGAEWLAGGRRIRSRGRARCAGSRSCCCARRRVLRHGPPRAWHSHSQRCLPQLLPGHRECHAGGSRNSRSAEGALRRPVRDGGRHDCHDPGPRVRARGGRAGRVPLSELHSPQVRSAGCVDRGLGRRARGAGPARSDVATAGARRRDGAGDLGRPCDRSRYAGGVVYDARSEPPVEAGAEHPRAGHLSPPRSARCLVGIDLGTTNSAVAWMDASDSASRMRPRLFEVLQVTSAGETDARITLPSFLYFLTPDEQETGAIALPWDANPDAVAGVFARDHGALVPTRQVSSAKSWLSNPAVDRRAPLLPWAAEASPELSPVEASTRLLAHLRDAWNHAHAGEEQASRLQHQEIVLTVPASFDEEARELTVEAAREAGFEHLTLLEEPLAALYAWIASHPQALTRTLTTGQLLLVCDVGGGTTDFSLIRATAEAGPITFERIAIGEHLLLGGDNVDLALAAL